LSITVLPTWTSSPHLPRVLASVAEPVLQVHAVQNPRSGLFDASVARGWIDDFAHHIRKPFRIALPTYGARVSWNADGHLLAIESERPLLIGGAASTELMAAPEAVAGLLRDLEQHPPPTIAGVVWFRLPTQVDQRAWSLPTWRAVTSGVMPDGVVTVKVDHGDSPGLSLVALENTSAFDAILPRSVLLPGRCTLADGINDYGLIRGSEGLALRRQQSGLLRSHALQVIGWIRCDVSAEEMHVVP
jgi:hypothetical protein